MLIKLLHKHGFECDENPFGFRTFRREGCRDVEVYPSPAKATCDRLVRQVNQDVNRQKPVTENEWEATERRRAEAQTLREAADAARVKNTRLGGLSAVLTEAEVDAVAYRAEQDLAARRRIEQLIREAPLRAGRKR